MVITRSMARNQAWRDNIGNGVIGVLGGAVAAQVLDRLSSYARSARSPSFRLPTPPSSGGQQGMSGVNALISAGRNIKSKMRGRKRISRKRKLKPMRKRISRKRLRGAVASLGKVAVVGGRDEEDRQVKRHMRRGIVYEYGSSGQITGAHGGMVVHSTMPQQTFLKGICLALVKSVMYKVGINMKDPSDVIPSYQGFSSYQFKLDYLVSSGGTTSINSVTTVTFTAAIDSFHGIAIYLYNAISGITVQNAQAFVKFGNLYFISSVSGTNICQVDMDVTKFNIDLVSNLVYQNRSVSQEATGNTNNAFDVAQDPLFEVQLIGRGTGPKPVNDTATNNFFVDNVTGLDTLDSGNNAWWLAEPSKSTYLNVLNVVNTISNPGIVKQSKLKSHYNFTLSKLVPFLNMFSSSASINQNYVKLGKYKLLWFRKTIDLGSGDTQNYKIAYQHHFAAGITCSIRRDGRTVPFIANIQ